MERSNLSWRAEINGIGFFSGRWPNGRLAIGLLSAYQIVMDSQQETGPV